MKYKVTVRMYEVAGTLTPPPPLVFKFESMTEAGEFIQGINRLYHWDTVGNSGTKNQRPIEDARAQQGDMFPTQGLPMFSEEQS